MVTEKVAFPLSLPFLFESFRIFSPLFPFFFPFVHLPRNTNISVCMCADVRANLVLLEMCRAHLYFVSARKSGIRGRHEMLSGIGIKNYLVSSRRPMSRSSFSMHPLPSFPPNPKPFPLIPVLTECKGGDQWMQRSDTFRQYITINYTCIGNKLIYYDYIKLD